jgi:hypothetical protein
MDVYLISWISAEETWMLKYDYVNHLRLDAQIWICRCIRDCHRL